MSTLKLWIASGTAAALAACGGSPDGNGGTDAAGSGGSNGSGTTHTDAPAAASGTAYSLVSVGGFAYTATVIVGGQMFGMDVDTGSTTLGVAGAKCTTCGVTPEYTPGASAMDQKKTAKAVYGLGQWTGEIYSDTVALMGDTTPVTMKFADITTQSQFFQAGEGQEGIIGMGPADLELMGTDSYMVQRGAKSMAFQLCPDEGTMWIDGYDPSKMATAIQYVPIDGQGYWQVGMDSSTINGNDNMLTGVGVLDTGTSLIITSTAAQTAIVNNIKGSSGFTQIFGSQTITLPSDQNGACLTPTGSATSAQIDAALPPFKMTIGSVTLSVPATQSYLLAQQGSYCFDVDADDDLTSGGIGAILGDMFLRGFVTIFDMQNNQAGFAMQAGCTLPVQPKAAGPVHMPHWYRHGRPQ
jgi:hypothetical protein